MSNRLTDREWEQLSAYLDNQLSSRDREQFERKLADQLNLQQAMDDLSRTRSLLRSAPRRVAPRNFTLTPSMVRVKMEQRLFPFFSWASATAMVLFVLSFIFRLMPLTSPAGLFSASDTAAQPAPGAFRAPEALPSEKSQPVPGITWGTPPPGMLRPQLGVRVVPPSGMGVGQETDPKATPLPPVQPVPVGTQPPPSVQKIVPSDTALPTPGDRQPTPGIPKKGEPNAGPVLGIPTEKAGQIIATSPVSIDQDGMTGREPDLNGLVVVQIGLMIAAVLLGVMAVILRLRFKS